MHKQIAFVAAMALLAMALAWQAWGLMSLQAGRFIDDEALLLRDAGVKRGGATLGEVASWHVFGNPADKPPPEPAVPENLPATDLKFVLVGAITETDPQQSSALISVENTVQRFYVGDDIRGQAVLHEVAPDSVVLKRGNRFEQLQFPKGGELNPEAREALAKLGHAQPRQGAQAAPPPARAKPAPTQGEATATGARPQERTGRSLREKLQKTQKVPQKPPGS